MEYLAKAIVEMVFVCSLIIAGLFIRMINTKKRSKRKDIPEGMNVLFEDSQKLYIVCAIPIIVTICVCGLILMGSYMYKDSLAEIAKQGGIYFLLLVLELFTFQILGVLLLKSKNRQKILWNDDGIWVDSVFKKRKYIRYEDIRKIIHYKTATMTKSPGLIAYGWDDEKLFYATETMTDYQRFYWMLCEKKRSYFTITSE